MRKIHKNGQNLAKIRILTERTHPKNVLISDGTNKGVVMLAFHPLSARSARSAPSLTPEPRTLNPPRLTAEQTHQTPPTPANTCVFSSETPFFTSRNYIFFDG